MADLNALEQVLASSGLNTPAARTIVGSLIAGGAVWIIKPSFAFDAAGKPLPFGPGSSSERGKGTTRFPWYFVAGAGGFVLGFLI